MSGFLTRYTPTLCATRWQGSGPWEFAASLWPTVRGGADSSSPPPQLSFCNWHKTRNLVSGVRISSWCGDHGATPGSPGSPYRTGKPAACQRAQSLGHLLSNPALLVPAALGSCVCSEERTKDKTDTNFSLSNTRQGKHSPRSCKHSPNHLPRFPRCSSKLLTLRSKILRG